MSLLNQGQPTDVATGNPQDQQTLETQGTPEVDWEKRYKDLQSYHDKTRNGLQRQLDELKAKTGEFVLPRTKEELEDFKARNPEHFGTIETVAHMMVQDQIKPLQSELYEAKRQAAIAELQKAHPDFAQYAGDENFKAWAEAEGLSDWLSEEMDPSKPIRALSFYKNFLATQQTQQQPVTTQPTVDPAAQAVNVNSGAPTPTGTEGLKTYTRDQLEKMSVAEYEANYDSIMKAYQAGLVR